MSGRADDLVTDPRNMMSLCRVFGEAETSHGHLVSHTPLLLGAVGQRQQLLQVELIL